jgi:hypothetical protein
MLIGAAQEGANGPRIYPNQITHTKGNSVSNTKYYVCCYGISSVAEPELEPQGAASFARSRIRSRNAVRLRIRLRLWRLRLQQEY